jgi:cell division protein FtsZ
VVWNITGPSDLSLFEVNEAAAIIYDLVDPEANLIFGTVIDPTYGDQVSVTIIATGFGGAEPEIGALKGQASIRQPALAAPQQQRAPPPMPMPAASNAPSSWGTGGIEIPDFLRRRRQQGK